MIARNKAGFVIAAMALLVLPARAQQPGPPPILREVSIAQRLNEPIPPDIIFRDEDGKAIHLGDYFGKKPIVLSLVYFDCPALCTEVLNGELRTMKAISLDLGKDFDAITVSFEPKDTPALAKAKRDVYAGQYGRPGAARNWHFLTGEQASIDALTQAAGFHYAYDSSSRQYAHAAAILVLTPHGRIARYFYGVTYPARDFRLGLVEASEGKIRTPTDHETLMQGISFQPEQASSIARSVDHLYFFITAVTLFFTIVIFSTIFYFMLKYRRRSPDERPKAIEGSLPLEVLWTAIPTLIVAAIFVWGSSLYFQNSEPPPGAMEIFVTGKQFMWKAEHPEGQREINELHVPLGRPVKLTMTSEDVIHDFFVPAFRVKKDVLPGRYTSMWFEPTKLGTFHLFCAQYCGAFHAGMIGSVIVVEPDEYERWLMGGVQGESMEAAGERLFRENGCITCHLSDGTGPAPSLLGVYGNTVHLTNGQTLMADDAYIRESILSPAAKVVNGYKPVMPSFQGQLSEEQIVSLVAYIRSLGHSLDNAKGKQQEEGKK